MTVPITYFKAIRKLGNGPSMPPSDEEVQPVLNPPINGGGGSGQIPPVAQRYASEAAMISDQANQESGYLYFDGTNTWWYLGTTGGVIGDYQKFYTYQEALEIETNTVIFDNDYIIGNTSPRTGNILFDFTGAKRGATIEMRHNDAASFTFPAESMLMFDVAEISTTDDNFYLFVLTNKTVSSEVVKVYHAMEGGIL